MPDAVVWLVVVMAPTPKVRDAVVAAIHAVGIEATVEWGSSESVTVLAGPTTWSKLDECLSATELPWTAKRRPDVRDRAIHSATDLLRTAQKMLWPAIAPPDPGRRRLLAALAHAYPDYDRVNVMLNVWVGASLANVCAPAALDTVWWEVLSRAEAGGWDDRLRCGAWRGNPGNPQLRSLMTGEFAFCARCGIIRGDRCPELDPA